MESLINSGEIGATLTRDEVTIIKGALDLSGKVVKDAMTPIDKVMMLDVKQKLDAKTLEKVFRSSSSSAAACRLLWLPDGFSLLPIDPAEWPQQGSRLSRVEKEHHRHAHCEEAHHTQPRQGSSRIRTHSAIKKGQRSQGQPRLLTTLRIQEVELVRLPTVSENMGLYPLLNLFQRGQSMFPPL